MDFTREQFVLMIGQQALEIAVLREALAEARGEAQREREAREGLERVLAGSEQMAAGGEVVDVASA